VIAIQIYVNYPKVDGSGIYIFEDYTKSLLNSVEPNSIIISYQWDYFISASYYYQNVEEFRRDVSIIDKKLLRRSWYFNQIENYSPDVINKMSDLIDKFLQALTPFRRGEKFNPVLLEKLYQNILTRLVTDNIDQKNIYLGGEMVDIDMRKGDFKLPGGYSIVPHLFLYKVVKSGEYAKSPDPDFEIRIPNQSNKYIKFLKNGIPTMLARRALYEIQNKKIEKGQLFISKILNDFPGYRLPHELQNFYKSNQ